MVSVGRKAQRKAISPGIILAEPLSAEKTNSVMGRFLEEGIPVIHLENIKKMAAHYGLELHPAKIPSVGEGNIFFRTEYNRLLASFILLGVLFVLYIFARSDIGFRISQATTPKEELGPPEPMI